MKYAIKVKDQDCYVAVQRFPGFTSCSRKGSPGIYDVWVFNSKEEAQKILDRIPKENRGTGWEWEVIEWTEAP